MELLVTLKEKKAEEKNRFASYSRIDYRQKM